MIRKANFPTHDQRFWEISALNLGSAMLGKTISRLSRFSSPLVQFSSTLKFSVWFGLDKNRSEPPVASPARGCGEKSTNWVKNPLVGWANSMERGYWEGWDKCLGGSWILVDVVAYPKVKNSRGGKTCSMDRGGRKKRKGKGYKI